MKYIAFILLSFLTHIISAQITADQIKADLTNKVWKITKYETFGVSEDPKEAQVNDKILLNSDMTFLIVENGKEYKGKWSILNPPTYITCKSIDGNWSITYKIISIGEKASIIQFKDPDLVKTDFHLEVVE